MISYSKKTQTTQKKIMTTVNNFKMNRILLIAAIMAFTASSCKKIIDVYPASNLYEQAYYTNVNEINNALTGCYNGMQKPLFHEWSVTELRGDNSIMGNPTSGSADNRELSDLDIFMPSTSHEGIYNYWLNSYYNVYNVNKVLSSVGVNYHSSTGELSYDSITIPVSLADRKRISAEASFIRAYHYFNLVRLYGGVFLIDRPVTPAEAKQINRSSVEAIYKLIVADLQNAISNGSDAPFNAILSNNLGRANAWSAKAMLAKVYLTLNRKSDAAILLQDIIANSRYALQANYSDVFSTTNEMNSEILFAIRYKSGKVGLGSPFSNLFAPNSSGMAIVNGDGQGYNYPALEIMKPTQGGYDSTVDKRYGFNIGKYVTKLYVKKYISNLVYEDDAENDWPVIRYADVLLMLAEANGNSTSSVDLINQVRTRSGQSALSASSVATDAQFESALSTERRLEFAFENQRWFDVLRFGTTLTTINAIDVMKNHFANMYTVHYDSYPQPLTLSQIQNLITADHLLLPIPQREIDNNTIITIPQNPGY
jgi:hypothetical protein